MAANCPTCGMIVESIFDHLDLDTCPQGSDWGPWRTEYSANGWWKIVREMKGNAGIIDIYRNARLQAITYKGEEVANIIAESLNQKKHEQEQQDGNDQTQIPKKGRGHKAPARSSEERSLRAALYRARAPRKPRRRKTGGRGT